MAYLREIPKYKRNLVKMLLESSDIFTEINNVNAESSDDLYKENIFQYHYIPDVEVEARTYVCFDIFVSRISDRLFKDLKIVFNVFSHKSVADNKKGYCRVDEIDIAIDELLNGNNENFGFDSVELVSVSPYTPNSTHTGKQLVYKVNTFNQLSCKHGKYKV